MKGGEEEEEEECVEWGCQVQGHRCVCEERECESHTPLLSEDACYDTLKKVLCNNVICPEVRTQSCPADSFLTHSFTPPGHCCPLVVAQCTCNFQLCSPEPTSCPEDTRPQLVAKGDGHPGTCCHRYECVREED
ncbi:cysteine-rich motor neuron 1 protein-like [Colossoma macropomum]|uniref:cysteine-rich motor neuron 1 protein-like n=1 Tax=Colossoma macropomum TaxID=42526 RepID=UPI0018656356|nr:cysteine-rich motor neuron 1 protein-like [Colossoma macropomum]